MKKRILSMALALIFTLALIPSVFAAGESVTLEDELGQTLTISAVQYEQQETLKIDDYDFDIGGSVVKDVQTTVYYVLAGTKISLDNVVTIGGVSVYEKSLEDVYSAFDGGPTAGVELTFDGYVLARVWLEGMDDDDTIVVYLKLADENGPAAAAAPEPAPEAELVPTPISEPEPAPEPEPIPAPVPVPVPAPISAAVGSAAELKTTDGLVAVIPPAPVSGQDLAYTVQTGEKLWSIAFNYYGSMDIATINKIYAANAAYFKATKGILEAGAVITLPAKGLIAPVTQTGLDKAAGTYLVKAGDTLSDIAKAYYGDSAAWIKIYEANKERVKLFGKSSPMIYDGQWLVIPE